MKTRPKIIVITKTRENGYWGNYSLFSSPEQNTDEWMNKSALKCEASNF